MEKSKFGFIAVLYPLLIMLCVLFSQIWVGLAIFGFALVTEKNERISKMSLHAALYFFVWPLLTLFSGQLRHFFFTYLPWQLGKFSDGLSYDTQKMFNTTQDIFRGLGSILFLGYIFLLIFFGVMPLLAGKEMKLPFKKKVDVLFGAVVARAPQYQPPQPPPQYQPQPQYQPPQPPPQYQPQQYQPPQQPPQYPPQ